jgi:hypothetical protein
MERTRHKSFPSGMTGNVKPPCVIYLSFSIRGKMLVVIQRLPLFLRDIPNVVLAPSVCVTIEPKRQFDINLAIFPRILWEPEINWDHLREKAVADGADKAQKFSERHDRQSSPRAYV